MTDGSEARLAGLLARLSTRRMRRRLVRCVPQLDFDESEAPSVSYADSGQGHAGTIYQATNWIFLGGSEQSYIKVLGKVEHPRSLYDRYGRNGQSIPWLRQNIDPRADRVPMPPKWKYVMPLTKELRRKLEALAQPYPRGRSDTSDTPGDQPGEGEAASTRPLQPPPP